MYINVYKSKSRTYTFICSYNILYSIDILWMFLLKQSLKIKLQN